MKKPKIKPKIYGKTKNQLNILWSNEGHFRTTIRETVINVPTSSPPSNAVMVGNLKLKESKFKTLSTQPTQK